MDKQLTERRNKARSSIYDFIVDFITSHGYSPSLREIADGTGIGVISNVREYLYILERLGLMHIQAGKSRTISLVGYKFVKKAEE